MTLRSNKPPVPTPENTPVPGGGSWRWTPDGWAENTPPANPEPAPSSTDTLPTLE